MHTGLGYDKCLTFINCQIKPAKLDTGKRGRPPRFRAVTLSRESGSGAHEIADHLAARLQSDNRGAKRPWTVFDKDLVTRVLEDHHLPDRRTELQDAVEEFFGLRPPSWTLIHHISETVLRLVELGNVILIGHGSSLVTRSHADVLHVRLVGSEPIRAMRIADARKISRKAALEVLRKEDRGRARYVKKYFGENIEDPRLYHMVFNTDLMAQDHVVTILDAVISGRLESIGA
jgi:cytidylate kinase